MAQTQILPVQASNEATTPCFLTMTSTQQTHQDTRENRDRLQTDTAGLWVLTLPSDQRGPQSPLLTSPSKRDSTVRSGEIPCHLPVTCPSPAGL